MTDDTRSAAERAAESLDLRIFMVSTPEFGKSNDGSYTLPVMKKIEALSRYMPFVVIAYDWAGSTNKHGADAHVWERLDKLTDDWQTATGSTKMDLLKEIGELVKGTHWYTGYKGQIKGNIKSSVQSSTSASTEIQLICIEGGPISRIEQLEMPSIKEEIVEDLRGMGIFDRDIRIVTYPSFKALEDTLDGMLSRNEARRASVNETRDEFVRWLKKSNLDDYQAAFKDLGLDHLDTLAALNDAEVEEITSQMKMKFGHKKQFPIAIQRLKRQQEEEEEEERRRKKKAQNAQEEEAEEERRTKKKAQEAEERTEGAGAADSTTGAPAGASKFTMPPGKEYFAFLSHKKRHSELGGITESIAIRVKDHMQDLFKLRTFFDVDNLQQITMASLTAHVKLSCAVVLFLDSESMTSTWVVHECQTARQSNIPIICVVDLEHNKISSLVDQYTKLGFPWLFQEQCIGFTVQYRKACYDNIRQSVINALAANASKEQNIAVGPSATNIHEEVSVEMQFRRAVIAKFENSDMAWRVLDGLSQPRGQLSRTDFKAILTMVGLKITNKEKGKLRKLMDRSNTKLITQNDFKAFMEESEHMSDLTAANEQKLDIAKIPVSAPTLPDSYSHRPQIEERILDLLMGNIACRGNCISAFGMGGSGKTSTTVAVLRSNEELLQRFSDGIAWIGLSQKPKLRSLQRHLFFQLGTHMPKDKQGSAEEQLQHLVNICATKNLLIIIDDCWDAAHHKLLDVTDKQTESRILLSTRIAGLLPKQACVEVKLSLMTTQEAINMLAHGAGLDSMALSPSMVEVARLCGCLPLCLNIAAQMIGDSAETWEEDVLPDLRSELSKIMGNNVDQDNLSVQDSIILTSLQSITGSEAEDTKQLLSDAHIYAEDQRVPFQVFGLQQAARASIEGKGAKVASAASVRRWLKVLVGRSLVLQLIKGSAQIHDIVRDYICKEIDAAESRRLQQSFVNLFISSQDSWEEVVGDRIPRGKELDWYMGSGGISYHMSCGCKKPLSEDTVACEWLQNSSAVVQAQAAAAFETGDIIHLAQLYSSQSEHSKAGRVYLVIINHCVISREQQLEHANACLAVLDSLQEKQAEHEEVEAKVCGLIQWSLAEWGSPEYEDALSRQLAMYDRGVDLGAEPTFFILTTAAYDRLGVVPGKLNPSNFKFVEGVEYYRKAASLAEALSLDVNKTAKERWWFQTWSFFPIGVIPCRWASPQPFDSQEKARFTKENLLKYVQAYSFEDMNEWLTQTSVTKCDLFIEHQFPMSFFFWGLGCISVAQETANAWEQCLFKKFHANGEMMSEYAHVLPHFSKLQDNDRLCRVFSGAGVDFHNADELRVSHETSAIWTLPDDSAFCCHPQTVIMFAKVPLCLIPGNVETEEIVEYLPTETCRWFNDIATTHWGTSVEGLGTRVAGIALALGESGIETERMQRLACNIGKEEMTRHRMLYRSTSARMIVARARTGIERAAGDHGNTSIS